MPPARLGRYYGDPVFLQPLPPQVKVSLPHFLVRPCESGDLLEFGAIRGVVLTFFFPPAALGGRLPSAHTQGSLFFCGGLWGGVGPAGFGDNAEFRSPSPFIVVLSLGAILQVPSVNLL